MTWKRRLKNHSGDGAIEYILIVALVLGVVMVSFWGIFAEALEQRINNAGFQVTIPGKRKPKPHPAPPQEESGSGGVTIIGGGGTRPGTSPTILSTTTRPGE